MSPSPYCCLSCGPPVCSGLCGGNTAIGWQRFGVDNAPNVRELKAACCASGAGHGWPAISAPSMVIAVALTRAIVGSRAAKIRTYSTAPNSASRSGLVGSGMSVSTASTVRMELSRRNRGGVQMANRMKQQILFCETSHNSAKHHGNERASHAIVISQAGGVDQPVVDRLADFI